MEEEGSKKRELREKDEKHEEQTKDHIITPWIHKDNDGRQTSATLFIKVKFIRDMRTDFTLKMTSKYTM